MQISTGTVEQNGIQMIKKTHSSTGFSRDSTYAKCQCVLTALSELMGILPVKRWWLQPRSPLRQLTGPEGSSKNIFKTQMKTTKPQFARFLAGIHVSISFMPAIHELGKVLRAVKQPPSAFKLAPCPRRKTLPSYQPPSHSASRKGFRTKCYKLMITVTYMLF